MSKAAPLDFDKKASITIALDGNSPCLKSADGSQAPYTIFRLPDRDGEYLASLTSQPVGDGIFWPKGQILDAEGHVLRELPEDAFTFHSLSLYAGFRVHKGDEYILVTTDPRAVGKQIKRISEQTHQSIVGGPVFVAIYSGADQSSNLVEAYNGTMIAAIQAMPAVK